MFNIALPFFLKVVHRILRASLLATAASCRSHLSPLMRKAALTTASLLATAASCRRSLPCRSRTLRASSLLATAARCRPRLSPLMSADPTWTLLATAARSCRRYLLSQARTLSASLFWLARSCRCRRRRQELVVFQAGLRL
jgi:hypothetical protein